MNSSIGELPGAGEKVWYIIEEHGHQGPFSFIELQSKSLNASIHIWAKGWPVPLNFEVLRVAYQPAAIEEPPPLPLLTKKLMSLKEETVERPQIFEEPEDKKGLNLARKSKPKKIIIAGLGAVFLVWSGLFFWLNKSPHLQRPESLPLILFRMIDADFEKTKANGPIEILGVSGDYSKVWLADRSKQNCTYDLSLVSEPLENLSGEKVSLQSEGESNNHWVLFDRWTFNLGFKLWPGHYQATLSRVGCQHRSKILSWLKPDRDLLQTFRATVFVGNKIDLENGLTALKNKALEEEQKAHQALVMSWRDIEEKCRTLSAISLQIQQGFGLLSDYKIPWRSRVKNVVNRYTLRFGGFLTNFTIRNEEDFNRIGRQKVLEKVLLMEKGPIINNYAKKIGFLSMSLIEWLPKKTHPKKGELEKRLQNLKIDLEKVRQGLEAEANLAQKIYNTKLPPKKKK